MNLMVLAAFFVSAALLTLSAIAVVMPLLRRAQILDIPNDRSSHAAPTPRGAGLALVPVMAALWIAIGIFGMEGVGHGVVWIAAGAVGLCALSWYDDVRGLSPLLRFGAHILVVALLLAVQPPDIHYAQGLLPLWADRLAAGFVWLWFINLFNFMDGIDGISGVETISIAAGLVALVFLAADIQPLALPAVVLAGAALGFLFLNWHPAKIFLGDSGSVPLGLLLGWLLLDLAGTGYWMAALILPLYYLSDATLTILRRLLRGEKIWRAHRQHFYQRAVAGGLSHARVVSMIALTNIGLIALALASVVYPVMALFGAAVIVAVLLAVLQRRAVAA